MINAVRGNTVEAVCGRILQDLKDGKLRSGERLVAHALADRYRVSRTPVREALLKLEKEGFVTGTANAGFEPRRLTLEELCELYELRELLEGFAVEKLTERGCPPELIRELKRLCNLRRTWHANGNDEDGARVDQQFHQLICDSCGSPLIQKVLRSHLELSVIFNANPNFLSLLNAPRDVDGEHELIIAAMEAGKSKLARKHMAAHIANARKCFEKALRRRQRLNAKNDGDES
jgi:GntR family transcriptional regulator of vanillate catabolism